MIHPMWATFYAAIWPELYRHAPARDLLESESSYLQRMAKTAALAADASCAEYDLRDKPDIGSPYRG